MNAQHASIGGLSNPSKMPTLSYSTPPASTCGVGSALAEKEGTICSDCYARKGTYLFASTREAMARRDSILRAALASPEALAQWVADFVGIMRKRFAATARLIKRTGRPGRDDGRFFRWHDAGDLVSGAHLAAIVAIAEATPEVSYWLPTKESGRVRQFLAEGKRFPSNLRVRLSVSRTDAPTPPAFLKMRALDPQISFAGAHTDAPASGFVACIAPRQDGACRDCRACWGDAAVSYNLH